MSIALPRVDCIDAINQAILDTAARPLSSACALPAAAYTDDEYFAWESSQVLRRQWLAVAHVSQIPDSGDYVNLTLLGERLSVVRGADGAVRVLSRVCAHRGMDVMPPETGHAEQGNCRHYRCPYHHWVYDLSGSLKGAPFMKEHAAVTGGTLKLHEFRSEVWEGFVFVNFSADAQPLAECYAGLLPYLARWRIGDLVMVIDQAWDCPFNWKVLVENFMEPYHHAGAHHTIFQPLMPAQGCWTEAEAEHYTICHLPLADGLREQVRAGEPQLLAFPPLPGLEEGDFHEWTVYLGHPDFLLFVAPDRVYWYRIEPLDAGRMRLRTTLLVSPAAAEVPDFPRIIEEETDMLRRFHLEDMEVCGAVQAGLASQAYTPGPLSELEAPIWLFQRYLARQIRSVQTPMASAP